MRYPPLLKAATLLLLIGLPLAGCASQQQYDQTACAQGDVRAHCLLDTAQTVLATIEDPFDWSTSAVELALAKDSQGDSANAIADFQSALQRTQDIQDPKRRATAIGDIALGLSKLNRNAAALEFIPAVRNQADKIASADVKWDVVGKLITAQAVHGDLETARRLANALPTQSDTQDAYKGRTLREVAAIHAKAGDFDGAIGAINDITASFTYYEAIARTDVTAQAVKAGRPDIVEPLFREAAAIAAQQDNGYFSGAILRDIGYSLVKMGQMDRADAMFSDALALASNAKSLQEQARATSRIATRLADCGLAERARPVLEGALFKARQVDSRVMRPYSLYEIAGSAAFAGEFDIARTLIGELPETPFGSAASLKSASERDLAWGLARADRLKEAVQTANAITSKRERVHALSRLVRLIRDPQMSALPRYL